MDPNRFYRQAVESLTQSLELDKGLQNCIRYINTVMPGDVLSVHLWDEERSVLRILATASVDQGQWSDIDIQIPADLQHIPRWQQRRGVKFYNDSSDDPISQLVEQHLAELYGSQDYSHLISRVRVEHERICDIALLAKGRNRFTQDHAALFSSLDSPFGIAVVNALKHRSVKQQKRQLLVENQRLRQQLPKSVALIGHRSGLRQVVDQVHEVARTTAPVLLQGETGVGKDVVANLIQQQSLRANKPYIRVNCGAIPESLIDSELFGHEKGAFTGAHSRQIGRFERADGGTIFLDEVGELNAAGQVKLLRVLQNAEIERVGGTHTIHVDIRVIAATNQPLLQMVEQGRFRADLYYRLCVFPIAIPPLRQRLEDIGLLAEHFIQQCSERTQLPAPPLTPEQLSALQQYHWPGNVRELANVIERAVISGRGQRLALTELSQPTQPTPAPDPETTSNNLTEPLLTLEQLNRQHILQALSHCQGQLQGKGGAAELLDINPHTLRSRIKKLGITIS